METIAIIGAGSVGRAVGQGLAARGHAVAYGVRTPDDPKYHGLAVVPARDAVEHASVVVLAVPAAAVADAVPGLGLRPGQVLVDATNAVRDPVPDGHATMADFVATLLPDGVALVKAFNTVGAEHLGGGSNGGAPVFLPIAGDPAGVDVVRSLAGELGFDVAPLGGRERFAMVEDHARLWIHLAFACGWGRQFAFSVVRP